MTLTSQIIIDAFRQSNLLSISANPTTAQSTEALRYLNRLVKSVFGNEAGDPFTSMPIGRNNISRPAGYPWYDTTPDNDWYVPVNTRVILNVVTPGVQLYLTPAPDDGCRFAAIDASNDLSLFPVTVFGNGQNIEGLTSVSLDTDGFDAEWFYRADLANWLKYAPLTSSDPFPFPEEFDDFFITMLALRLNPAYGQQLDAQVSEVLRRSKTQLRARYSQITQIPSELALIRPAYVAADRDTWGNAYWWGNADAMFTKGWPW